MRLIYEVKDELVLQAINTERAKEGAPPIENVKDVVEDDILYLLSEEIHTVESHEIA